MNVEAKLAPPVRLDLEGAQARAVRQFLAPKAPADLSTLLLETWRNATAMGLRGDQWPKLEALLQKLTVPGDLLLESFGAVAGAEAVAVLHEVLWGHLWRNRANITAASEALLPLWRQSALADLPSQVIRERRESAAGAPILELVSEPDEAKRCLTLLGPFVSLSRSYPVELAEAGEEMTLTWVSSAPSVHHLLPFALFLAQHTHQGGPLTSMEVAVSEIRYTQVLGLCALLYNLGQKVAVALAEDGREKMAGALQESLREAAGRPDKLLAAVTRFARLRWPEPIGER